MSKAERSKLLSQVSKSAKGAWRKARTAPAEPRGYQDLPGDLDNAVAELDSWKITKSDKGNITLTLIAICHEPEEIVGKHCRISYKMYETQYKSMEDNLSALAGDIKLLGGELDETDDLSEMAEVLDQLCETRPVFFFNTSAWEIQGNQGDTIKGVSKFIQGLVPDNELPEAGETTEPKEDSFQKEPDEAGGEFEVDQQVHVHNPDEDWGEWDGVITQVLDGYCEVVDEEGNILEEPNEFISPAVFPA